MRIAVTACLAALVFVVAGCGSVDTSAPAARAAEGAKLVPSDASAFVSIDTDLDSPQWQQVQKLAERFPGRDDLVAYVLKELGEENLDWARDLEPALGPQTIAAARKGSSEPVILTVPDDRAKLDALVAKSDEKLVSGDLEDGWVAVAKTQAEIDEFASAAAQASLADEDAFKEAMDGLPEDTVATVFLRGSALLGATSLLPSGNSPASDSRGGSAFFDWLGAGVEATDDGLHLVGAVHSESGTVSSYEPTLVDRIPDRVAVAASFGGAGDAIARLRSDEQLKALLPMIEQGLGIRFDDLEALFEGEGVLYVRAGLPIPEVTLALDVDDAAKAMATADRIMSAVAKLAKGKVETSGVTHTLTVEKIPISWTVVDGTLVVTSGANGVSDFRAPGDKLPDDAAFTEAAGRVGLGEKTSGFVYVDLKQAVPLLEGVATLAGKKLPAELTRNLEPLDTLMVNSTGEGEKTRFEGFLALRDR